MQDSSPIPASPAVHGDVAHATLPIRFERVGYAADTTQIVDGLDLEITAGDGPTVLMGPNGCGKTTLLKLVMGLIAPTSGRITFAGRPTASTGTRAIVFQKPVMLRRTAAANVAFALAVHGRPSTPSQVADLLEIAHIGGLANRPARRLSAGEQQRLALARALAREPQILLLDEPTANLDPAATKLVEDIVARVSATGVKIILATHDLAQARRLGRTIVFLVKGRIVEQCTMQRFFSDPATEQARRFLAGDLVI
jgi:tungstate transport system ATP-binding protein